jgi:hypothetical protein
MKSYDAMIARLNAIAKHEPQKAGTAQFLRDELAAEIASTVFPVGARVLVDGRDEAIVKQAFPEGSTSFLFSHYKLDFIGGDKNVAVKMSRVGVGAKT